MNPNQKKGIKFFIAAVIILIILNPILEYLLEAFNVRRTLWWIIGDYPWLKSLISVLLIILGIKSYRTAYVENEQSIRQQKSIATNKVVGIVLLIIGIAFIILDLTIDHSSQTPIYRDTAIGQLQDGYSYDSGQGKKISMLFVSLIITVIGFIILYKNYNKEKEQLQKDDSKSNDKQTDIYAQIKSLNELKEKGIITEEEFVDKKQLLLSKI